MADEPPALDRPIVPLGLLEGTTAISSTAAPLLAGFALTILLLIVPTTTVAGGGEKPFSRWPEPTVLLLVASAALLINAVQAGAHARSTHVTPAEAQMWLEEQGMSPAAIIRFRNDMRARTQRHIDRTRRLYQGGIMLLLAAITLVLVPPEGVELCPWRSASIAAALLATASESAWILKNAGQVWRVRRLRPPAGSP